MNKKLLMNFFIVSPLLLATIATDFTPVPLLSNQIIKTAKASTNDNIKDLLDWYSSGSDTFTNSEVLDNSLGSMRIKNTDGSISLIIFPSPYYSPAFTKGEKVDLNTKRTKKSQHTNEGTYIHFQISGVTNTEKLPTPIELPLKVKVHGKDSPLKYWPKFDKKQLAISTLDFEIRHQLTQIHGLYRSSDKTGGYWKITMNDGSTYQSDLSKKFEYNTEKPPINIDEIKTIEAEIN
ncbi:TPA: toxic shock syndrome toxin TSST-1 [Staphylococcus aureus]